MYGDGFAPISSLGADSVTVFISWFWMVVSLLNLAWFSFLTIGMLWTRMKKRRAARQWDGIALGYTRRMADEGLLLRAKFEPRGERPRA